jgi:hypothetical protein
MFNKYRNLWLALGVIIILSPLGLLATGTAFGEWGRDQLQEKVGFIPAGLARMDDLWAHAPLPGYGIPGLDAGFMQSACGYILSALVGMILITGIMLLLKKIVKE